MIFRGIEPLGNKIWINDKTLERNWILPTIWDVMYVNERQKDWNVKVVNTV